MCAPNWAILVNYLQPLHKTLFFAILPSAAADRNLNLRGRTFALFVATLFSCVRGVNAVTPVRKRRPKNLGLLIKTGSRGTLTSEAPNSKRLCPVRGPSYTKHFQLRPRSALRTILAKCCTPAWESSSVIPGLFCVRTSHGSRKPA